MGPPKLLLFTPLLALALLITLRSAAAECCCDAGKLHEDCCSDSRNTSRWMVCQSDSCPGPGDFRSRPSNCGSTSLDLNCACASSAVFPVGALVLLIVVAFLLVHFTLWGLCSRCRPTCCDREAGGGGGGWGSRLRSASGSSRQALAEEAAPPGYEAPPSYTQAAAAAGQGSWELGTSALECGYCDSSDFPPDPPSYDTIFTLSLRVARAEAAAAGGPGSGSRTPAAAAAAAETEGGGDEPRSRAGTGDEPATSDAGGDGGAGRTAWVGYDNPAFDPSDSAEELQLNCSGLEATPDALPTVRVAGLDNSSEV